MKNPLPLLVLVAVLCVPAVAGADYPRPLTVLDHINIQRMRMGFYPLLPDANLQATAVESVRRQAAGRRGHRGTLQTSSAEGVGSGRIGPGVFRFSACYHKTKDYTTEHRWAGAAIYEGRTCLSLDNDKERGAIGSARNGGSRKGRGGILKRVFGGRRS